MNKATLTGMRIMSEAMASTKNYAVQIEVCGEWQMVIDKLTESEAKQMSSRWERSRVVKTW